MLRAIGFAFRAKALIGYVCNPTLKRGVKGNWIMVALAMNSVPSTRPDRIYRFTSTKKLKIFVPSPEKIGTGSLGLNIDVCLQFYKYAVLTGL